MTDTVTTIAAGAILKLAFDEFIKSSAGEAAKRLTGEALVKANALRKEISNYFFDKKNRKATEAIALIEETGSENAFGRLEVYLENAIDDDSLFAAQLRLLVQEVEVLRTVKQVMVDGLKTEDSLEAKGFIQETTISSGVVEQTMLKNTEAKKKVQLTDFKQKT
ncbi:hypothetical protein QUB70_00705 [Microcoleus sp. A003_D6]|uniref:hypothetical protein n=1 Tax=Microcoleus sp. A003_D6 TaxID=3055266 RepID=UPI002FD37CA6